MSRDDICRHVRLSPYHRCAASGLSHTPSWSHAETETVYTVCCHDFRLQLLHLCIYPMALGYGLPPCNNNTFNYVQLSVFWSPFIVVSSRSSYM